MFFPIIIPLLQSFSNLTMQFHLDAVRNYVKLNQHIAVYYKSSGSNHILMLTLLCTLYTVEYLKPLNMSNVKTLTDTQHKRAKQPDLKTVAHMKDTRD